MKQDAKDSINQEKAAFEELSKYVDNYELFVDDSALLSDKFLFFWERVKNILSQKQKNLCTLEDWIGWAREKGNKNLNCQENYCKVISALYPYSNGERQKLFIVKIYQAAKHSERNDLLALSEYKKKHKILLIVDKNSTIIEKIQDINQDAPREEKIRIVELSEMGYLKKVDTDVKQNYDLFGPSESKSISFEELDVEAAIQDKDELRSSNRKSDMSNTWKAGI